MTTARVHPDDRRNVAPPPPRSRWYMAAALCAGGALIVGVAKYFAAQLPPTNGPRRAVVAAVHDWSTPVLTTCAALAIVFATVGLVVRRRQLWSYQIRTTLAHHLRIRADALTCRRLRHRGRRVVSGMVRYQPHVALPVDVEKAVTTALNPLASSPLAVVHTPRKRMISWGIAPPVDETAHRWWEVPEQPGSALITGVFNNLVEMLKGLDVVREDTRISDNPDNTKLTLSYAQTTKDISPNFKSRVRRILENKVPSPTGAWNLVWDAQKSRLIVRPGLALPEKVHIPDPSSLSETLPPRTLPLGVRVGGQLAIWNPPRFPHLLVAGPTGGGKSSFIRTLMILALARMWDVYLADPKRLSYRRGFACGWGLSHDRIATRDETIEAMVLAVNDEVHRRYRMAEWNPTTKPHHFAPTVLIIDENTEAIPAMHRAAAARWIAKNPEKRGRPPKSEAVEALWSIARLGRQVGVYLVLAHQRPDVRYIPGEARDNFMSVYAAGELSDDGLRMLFDQYGIEQRIYRPEIGPDGEPTQVAVEGRGTAQLGNGIEPVQGWWTPDPAEEDDCPPGSESARIMQRWAQACQSAQKQANHPLLPGIITIDPEQETALVQQEQRQRDQLDKLVDSAGADDGTSDDPDSPMAEPDDVPGASDVSSDHQDTRDHDDVGATAGHLAPTGGASDGDQRKQSDDAELRYLAVEQVLAAQHGATSMLQRKLRVGWRKANELMAELERLGVVGAAAGTQAREVLLPPDTDIEAVLQGEFIGHTDELEDDEQAGEQAGEQVEYEQVYVDDLFEGDLVILELDSGPVEVEIDAHPCESPHDSDRIEIEYRVIDPSHSEHGERSVTELPAQDVVQRRL